MRGLGRYVTFFCLLAASGIPAHANDSSARLEIGGLQLTTNADIEMQEEDLFLSRNEVRVRYKFFNKSTKPIETLVAFPLPEIETGEGGNYIVQSADPVNFIGFDVKVDGQPVQTSIEARATSMGVDVTHLLKEYNIPITTIAPSNDKSSPVYDLLNKLPEEAVQKLERYGAVDRMSSSRPDLKPDVSPRWNAHITFYWFQSFPAGRAIEVTHRYRPVPRSFFTSVNELASADMRRSHCVTGEVLSAAKRRERTGTLKGLDLRYITSTAGNWAGPIGTFNLTVEKDNVDDLWASCFKGLRATGPKTLSLQRKDAQSLDDIAILFVTSFSSAD